MKDNLFAYIYFLFIVIFLFYILLICSNTTNVINEINLIYNNLYNYKRI